MKTLDEVIEILEGIFGYISDSTKNDALHYLKEYRNCGDCAYTDSYLRCTQEKRNDPLDWDELKQMEGKPVWLEDSNSKGGWILLSGMKDEFLYFVYRDCVEYKIFRDKQGTVWQAYRKERSE